mmetsp:Transcript_9284/g.37558  ORF Transcript_9284/g.37558 Transcript_9284/m.37558 type:complete len:221 (-) Transcript_9284:591-1253(-)
MSSIWSASSTTSVRTRDMSRYGSSLAHVSNRPGVATTTSGRCASCSSCGFTDWPPCSVATFNPVAKHRRLAWSVTWCASSRVGTRTTHRGRAGVDFPGGFSASSRSSREPGGAPAASSFSSPSRRSSKRSSSSSSSGVAAPPLRRRPYPPADDKASPAPAFTSPASTSPASSSSSFPASPAVSASIDASAGIRYAAVLPLPVAALAMTSLPASASGTVYL